MKFDRGPLQEKNEEGGTISLEREYKSDGSKGGESLEQQCDKRGTGPLDGTGTTKEHDLMMSTRGDIDKGGNTGPTDGTSITEEQDMKMIMRGDQVNKGGKSPLDGTYN